MNSPDLEMQENSDYRRVTKASLFHAVKAIFLALNVPEPDAAIAADVLVSTDLRGIESHGVSNMLGGYVHYYETGVLNPTATLTVVKETSSTARLNGNCGLGIIQGPKAMRMAIDKARAHGIGMVTVSRSGHLGAIGHHALLAVEHDMIGMCFSANRPLMVPPGSAEALIGSNPLAIAAPTSRLPPVLFDIATTATAINKIGNYIRQHQPVPPGMIADDKGIPVMESRLLEKEKVQLLPIGSTKELGAHKGFGLAFIPEILSTFLSGALPFLLDPDHLNNHCFCVYNINCFTEVETFKTNLDIYLQRILDAETTHESKQVFYPGYPEYLAEQERSQNGIPLHREVIQWFEQFARQKPIPALDICG